MAITYENLMSTIANVAKAERITKAGLSLLSRDILSYMLESEDVRPVNTLLGLDDHGKYVLTPMNWRIAVQYFAHFIPWTSNYEEEVKKFAVKGQGERVPLVFNKKSGKRFDKGVERINAWLEDENNDIWVWSNNATVEAKPVDYAKKIQQAISSALDEDKGNMKLSDVMAAIVELEEINVHDLMAAMEAMTVPEAEAEAA